VSISTRVFSKNLPLQSAFFDSTSNIQMAMWFQPDLPFPAVDLSKLTKQEEDKLPKQLDGNIRRFNAVISRNFMNASESFDTKERLFDRIFYYD